MARTTGPPGRGVAHKLFAILDCFEATRASLTLTEISNRAEIPVSTTRRLLQELIAWGGLELSSDGGYRIGMRLWEVGSLAPRARGLREAALPYMQDLFEAAGQNVQLAVLEGTEALCVERIHGRRSLPTEVDIGERLPLHATATGKALLASSSSSLLRQVTQKGLIRYTQHTIVDPERLAVHLRQVRRTGLAFSSEERAVGAVGVASAIVDRQGRALGAVAIVAHTGTGMDRFGPAVRTAALGISRLVE